MAPSTNIEHRRAVSRAYYAANREVLLARSKAWQRANPDYGKAYRRANPERHKANLRRQRYGLEPEEYAAMLAAQDGKCAICDRVMEPPHVDHDHATGLVRGLLCDTCNRGIGYMQEDPKILVAAIGYLTTKEMD